MCLSTHTYLFIFPLPEQCRGGRCPAHRKNNLQWGGKKKKRRGGRGGVVKGKIYEYANLVTVWNLVMSGKCCCHLSLCRGHCLMPGSWAQILLYELPPPPSPPPLPLPPFLLSSHSNLNQTTAWQHSSQKTHKCTQGTHKRYRYTTPGCLRSYKET